MMLGRFWEDESGATAIEYGLLAAMLTIAIVGMLTAGGALEALYNVLLAIADAITGAGGGDGGG